MAYNQIAVITPVSELGTFEARLMQDGGSTSSTLLGVLASGDIRFQIGEERSIFDPIQSGLGYVQVRDASRYLAPKLTSNDASDFRFELDEGGSLRYRYVLRRYEGNEVNNDDPILRLVFYDGIALLKGYDYDLTGDTTIADLFYQLLDKTGLDLPIELHWAWGHDNIDTGTNEPEAIRLPAEDLTLGNDGGTYYDALRRLLSDHNLHLFQEAGAWQIMQRSQRTGTMDVYSIDTAGSITSGTYDPSTTISNFVSQRGGRRMEPSQPRQPGVGAARITRIFERETLKNADFELWNEADDSPEEWEGTATHITSPVDAAELDFNGEDLNQIETYPYRGGDDTYTFDFEIQLRTSSTYSAAEGDDVTAEAFQVRLISTEEGNVYYMDELGSWGTSTDYVEVDVTTKDPSTTVLLSQTITANAPPGPGAIEVIPIFRDQLLINGSQSGNDDLDWIRYRDVGEGVQYDDRALLLRGRQYTGSGDPSGEEWQEQVYLGDWFRDNPRAGTHQFLDDTTGRWEGTFDWTLPGGPSGQYRLHRLRVYDRLTQSSGPIEGIRGYIPPGDTLDMRHAPTYDGTIYIPSYLEIDVYKGQRRLVAWKVRSDSPTVSERYVWPSDNR